VPIRARARERVSGSSGSAYDRPMTVEAWKDRNAFDAHGMAAHTRQFRDRLAPMSGALYDERLYVVLED